MPLFDPNVPSLTFRSFHDTDAQRQAVFDSVLEGYRDKVVEDDEHRLEFADLSYRSPRRFTKRDEKDAIMGRKRLYHALQGRLRLIDKLTGQVVTEDKKPRTIAHVPYMTQLGLFVHNGSQYLVANQQRLKPGAYARRRESGDLETHFNVLPGTGRGFRIHMDHKTGLFRLHTGQSNIKLYPLLKDLGVKDEQMREAWGDDLFQVNKMADDKEDRRISTRKVLDKLGRYQDRQARTQEEVRQALTTVFNRMELDPKVMQRTFGRPIKNVTPEAILLAANKLLRLNRGDPDVQEDSREALPYQSFHTAEDFFREHVKKDAGQLQRQAFTKLKYGKDVGKVPNNYFSKQLQSVFLSSGLAAPITQINPSEILDQRYKVLRLGEGGIRSLDAVNRDARNIHPSHFGFIDPIRSPESAKIGLDMRLAYGAVKGSDGRLYQQVTDPRTGKPKMLSVEDFADNAVAFPGEFNRTYRDGTPTRKVRAMVDGRIRYVDRKKVKYALPSSSRMFTPGTNFVSNISGAKGQRALMGARMQSQALPLRKPEAPLVQTKMDDVQSFHQAFGREMGAVFSSSPGVVSKITDDEIVVRHPDGTKTTHELYNYMPFNQKCVAGWTCLFIRRVDGSFYTGSIENYEFQKGDQTLSVDKQTGRQFWADVGAVQAVDNDKTVLRVRLQSGRSVVVTEDHSLVTLRGGMLQKTEPGSIRVGKDFLPRPRGLITDRTSVPAFAKGLSESEFGQFIGIYLAEGCRVNKNCHAIACFEEQGADAIGELLKRLPGQKAQWNGSNVYVNANKALTEYIDLFVGHGAHFKRLDRSLVLLGPEFAAGVIGGFFSGDGWAAIDVNGCLQVEAGTRSQQLRDDLAFFADVAGIATTVRDMTVEGAPFYMLRVRTEDSNKVRWLLDRKEDVAASYLPNTRTYDHMPIDDHMKPAVYAALGSSNSVCHAVSRGRIPVRQAKDVPYLSKWCKDIRWDKVVAVEEVTGVHVVYDLSASDNVFWADGIFIHNTMITNTPVVKRGQKITPGQLLARSNYTDDQGQMAMGLNALVGYHMMEGMTHEDAIVVSESAAKRFSSEQLYNRVVERGDRVSNISKNAYLSKYPGRFDKRQTDQIDDNGVARVGSVVIPGDPLVLAVGEVGRKVGGSLMKGAKSRFLDSAEIWEHNLPGVVTDVDKTSKGYNVSVASHTPLKEGDKLAGGYGNKGVVARVVPDEEMPRTMDGRHLDLVLNPLGISTRTNPAQIIEASLGKVAAKTGQPYVLDGFQPHSLAKFAWDELRKHGLSDTENLVDPRTSRVIPEVFTGVQYFHKLHHLAESKLGARSTAGYTMEGTPARGGKAGAKRLDTLGTFSLLSSGATEVIRDAKLNRGQRNDDYWKLYRLGMRPPDPKKSLAYEKFENLLQASGINLRKKGAKTQVLPMTQKDVEKMTGNRQITEPETVDFNTMKNVKGGLFDVGLTGGQNGRKWSYIALEEPMPNPIMETPIKLLLGLSRSHYEDVLAGKEKIGELTGGRAIQKALSKVNIEREMDVAKDYLRSGRKTNRDKAVKKLGVLTMMQRNGLRPEELVMDRAPVLPPVFRPVTKMEGIQLVSDANYLYKDLMEANENVRLYRDEFGRPLDSGLDLYRAFKATMGLGDPVSKETQDRGVRGLLKQVIGSSPKFGQFQRKVLSTGTDLVGRGVLIPDPDLDVDEVGMPVDMAWEEFKPFVIRRLVRDGMKATEAFREWKTRGSRAQKQLLAEMKERPVIVNRAPALHKFNQTAHFAHPVAGDAIKLPIPILAGHGADFDGDTANVHVLGSSKAVEEAKAKLLPSKMLYSPKTWDVQMVPNQGFVTGLYLGTAGPSQKLPRAFPSKKAVIRAYKRGELDIDDPIVIGG